MTTKTGLPERPREILTQSSPSARWPAWLYGVLAGVSLYFFLCAIKVMGKGLKILAEDPVMDEKIKAFFQWADNPVAAMLSSVIVTALVQSSSFTTAMIVTLAAGQVLGLETAIYAVMGANIGTSVTNIIVSLGNVRIRRQFRRAFTAALVHDIFNWLTVALLFPLEWITSALSSDGKGFLARVASWMADGLGLGAMKTWTNPISVITTPVVDGCKHGIQLFGTGTQFVGTALAIVGLLMLFAALICLVVSLKGALLRRLEGLFRRVFFRNDFTAYSVGAVTTILVQSSSVTTSLIVPLAGAGVVKIKRVYPYTLGANLGTTITGVIAATAMIGTLGGPVAMAVAFGHVMFNLIGTAVWYPLRRVPIGIAQWYGRLAARSKRYAVLFLVLAFIVLPAAGLLITEIVMRLP